MREDVRREELGKYFLDISKYVLTVVVIGAIASERVDAPVALCGLGIGLMVGLIGFWTLPPQGSREGA